MFPTHLRIDALAIGVLLGAAAYVLGKRSHALLIGMAPAAPERKRIQETFERAPEVLLLRGVYTIHLSPSQLLLAADVQLRPDLDTVAVARVIDQLHKDLRREVPTLNKIFIEVEVAPHELKS